MVEFFWFKEGTKRQETPGLHKWEILSWETSQTNLGSLLSTSLCPQKAESMTWRTMQGFCPLSCRRTSTPPQHWLQPACSIATPTAAGARTAHTPSSLTAHTASNSSFANRIPQLGGENSRFFLWTFYFYVKNVFSNATYVQCKNGPKFPLHW